MEVQMNLPVIFAIAGCAALLVGLFGGGVKAKEIVIPKISTLPRILSSVAGLVLIGIAIWVSPNPAAVTAPTQASPSGASATPVQPSVVATTQIQPTGTMSSAGMVTEQPHGSSSMATAAPAQADLNSQTVYVHTVQDGNMSGKMSDIEHELTTDPDVLIFAMPSYESPQNPNGVYNKDFVAVWFRGSQWAIVNRFGNMPRDAAFNIRILEQGENAFVQRATSENITESWVLIDHPLASDPDALVFAMPTWSVSGESAKDNEHPIGVWYTGSQWAILNLDGAPMRDGAAFNVEIFASGDGAFLHKATPENIEANWTDIDDPLAYDEQKLVFVMPRGAPDGSGVNIIQPIGVWYSGSEWAIFNQYKENAMPIGAEFNVLIVDAK